MFTEAELAEHRADAEELMQDWFDAFAPAGTTTDADGYEVPAFTSKGQTKGKIQSRVRQGDVNTRYVLVGNVERPVIEGGLHIPVGAAYPSPGWEYQLAIAGPATDPALVGHRWRVEDGAVGKSWMTARRLDVVDVTPPEPEPEPEEEP